MGPLILIQTVTCLILTAQPSCEYTTLPQWKILSTKQALIYFHAVCFKVYIMTWLERWITVWKYPTWNYQLWLPSFSGILEFFTVDVPCWLLRWSRRTALPVVHLGIMKEEARVSTTSWKIGTESNGKLWAVAVVIFFEKQLHTIWQTLRSSEVEATGWHRYSNIFIYIFQ